MTRRAANEQAVKLAAAGRWQEAAALNHELLARFGDSAEVCNRLGKALTELGRIDDARLVYEKALSLDPMNAIAQRNLDRLAKGRETAAAPEPAARMQRGTFIEDVGKAAVARLDAIRPEALGTLDAGDSIDLEAQGNGVNALAPGGDYVGMVEARVGLRLARLMGGGNRYAATLVSNDDPPRIIVRETYQHPSQAGKVSFPKSNISAVRACTRRNFLREDVDDLASESERDHDDDHDGERSDRSKASRADALPEEGWTETRIDDEDDGGEQADKDAPKAAARPAAADHVPELDDFEDTTTTMRRKAMTSPEPHCAVPDATGKRVLARLHAAAEAEMEAFLRQAQQTPQRPAPGPRPFDAEGAAALYRDKYISLEREQGNLLYLLARSLGAKRAAEFGTSFGVSTIYLAAAMRDNGGGLVLGSEIEPSKAEVARANLTEAGLAEFAEIRVGDARETLADPGGALDLVLIDGFPNLNLTMLQLLAPHIRLGGMALADNVGSFPIEMAAYVAWAQDPANGFASTTLPLRGGSELSLRVAPPPARD